MVIIILLQLVKVLEQENELIAYYKTRGTVDKTDLRKQLESQLPAYMIPSYFVELEEFPLTSNGKVDKNNLPDDLINTLAIKPGSRI